MTVPLRYIQKQPPEVFYKKGVLENFVKFTRKHLCQSFFFNKVAGLSVKSAACISDTPKEKLQESTTAAFNTRHSRHRT